MESETKTSVWRKTHSSKPRHPHSTSFTLVRVAMPPKHDNEGQGKTTRAPANPQDRIRGPRTQRAPPPLTSLFLPPPPPPDKKPTATSPTRAKLPRRRSGKRAPAPRRATAPPRVPAPLRPRSAPVDTTLLDAAAASLAAAIAQGTTDAAAVVAGAEARARRDFAQRQPPPTTHPDDARAIEAAFTANTAFPPLRLPDDSAAWLSPVMQAATAVAAGLPADFPAIKPFPVRAKTFQVRLEFALMTQGGYTSGQHFLAAGSGAPAAVAAAAAYAAANPPPPPQDDKDDLYEALQNFFD